MPRIVDPRFPSTLRELRRQRGLSLRELAPLALSSRSHLHDLEQGRRTPTVETTRLLDTALEAGGTLVALVRDEIVLDHDDAERLRYAARHARVDGPAIGALATVLTHQRRLEDALGSAALVGPVVAQLRMIDRLIGSAPQDEHWPSLLDVAAGWAHFAGWLCTTTGNHAHGRAWYLRALEWATEAGNPHMIASVLSMRGHLAWVRGEARSMVELSRAAAWQPTTPGVRSLAVQQEARGLALLGDARGADNGLDRAEELAMLSLERPEAEPDWMYFYDPAFYSLQRGLAQHYLDRHDRATALLVDGIDHLPAAIRHSDWIGWYVLQLASAHLAAGEDDVARDRLIEVRGIVDTTGAGRLAGELAEVERTLGD